MTKSNKRCLNNKTAIKNINKPRTHKNIGKCLKGKICRRANICVVKGEREIEEEWSPGDKTIALNCV